MTPFKVFPSIGYINSQFFLVRFDDNCREVVIEKEGRTEKTIDLSQSKNAILTELGGAGIYKAKCTLYGKTFVQYIEIKNSIRFGTSELKSAFTFDEIPYSFFLMKDRMLIFDEINNQLLSENNISPSHLTKIDNQNILFQTRLKNNKNEIANYAVYSLLQFRIIWELKNDYKEISLLTDEKLLWVHDYKERRIVCYSFKALTNSSPTKIFDTRVGNFFYKLEPSNHLYIDSEKSISWIDLKTAQEHTVEKENNVAFDKQGFFYKLEDGTLTCKNILQKDSEEIQYRLKNLLNLIDDNFFFIGKNLVQDDLTDFETIINEVIERKQPAQEEKKNYVFYDLQPDEQIEKIQKCHSLFKLSEGIVLLTKQTSKKLLSITFRKGNSINWKATTSISSETKHELLLINDITSRELIKPFTTFSLIHSHQSCLVIKAESEYMLFNGNGVKRPIDSSSEILIDFNQNNYLLERIENNNFNLFSLQNLKVPILKDIMVFNNKYLRKHGVVWFWEKRKDMGREKRFLLGYNLYDNRSLNEMILKGYAFNESSDYDFKETYFSGNSSKTLINPKNGQVKDAVVGEVIATSASLNKVISRRDTLIYLNLYDSVVKKYFHVEIQIPVANYEEAHLSPNGKFLILQDNTERYLLFDIEKGEEINFFSGKFLAFSKEGNLIFEKNNTRAAKIIDPLTFKDITPPNYHHYRFMSPDGKLYAQVATKRRYYDKVAGKYIDGVTVNTHRTELDVSPLADEATKAKIQENRKQFFARHNKKLIELGIKEASSINSNAVIKTEVYTEIGIVGTNVIAEVPFPADIVYFNYAAFSYDNKYFGYVGKPPSKGLIHIFKLDFNPENNTLTLADSYQSRRPLLASWVCGFSKHGYFATYDSTPNTYIVKADEELFQNKFTDKELNHNLVNNASTIYSTYSKWIEITGKNFLCFSPTGNFIALSEQGYEPLTLGGYGHQESGALHIALASEGTIVDSFLEHGDRIKVSQTKKLVFVAFSEDETKIMSMSRDGVVIIRNIKLPKIEN